MGKWQVFLDTYAKIDDPMPGTPWNRGGMDYYFGNPRGSNGGGYVSASNANWEFDRHGILTGEAGGKCGSPSSQRGLTSKTLKSAAWLPAGAVSGEPAHGQGDPVHRRHGRQGQAVFPVSGPRRAAPAQRTAIPCALQKRLVRRHESLRRNDHAPRRERRPALDPPAEEEPARNTLRDLHQRQRLRLVAARPRRAFGKAPGRPAAASGNAARGPSACRALPGGPARCRPARPARWPSAASLRPAELARWTV